MGEIMDDYRKLALAWRAATCDAEYQKDPNPEHWRTIQGSHVHIDGSGHIDGGAGGKFSGVFFIGKGYKERAKVDADTKAKLSAAWKKVISTRAAARRKAKTIETRERRSLAASKAEEEFDKLRKSGPGHVTNEWKKKKLVYAAKLWKASEAPTLPDAAKPVKPKSMNPIRTDMKSPGGTVDAEGLKSAFSDFKKSRGKNREALYQALTHVNSSVDSWAVASCTPDLVEYHKIAAQREEKINKQYHASKAEQKHIQNRLKRIFDSGSFAMDIDRDVMDMVMGSWFKNSHEVSDDEDYNERRAESEADWFGKSALSGRDACKYGYLERPDPKSRCTGSGYGDATVRFKKGRLKGRVTYSFGDSLNNYSPRFASSPGVGFVDSPSLLGCQRDMDGADTAREAIEYLDNTDPSTGTPSPNDEYIELQYHGDLTIDDVESIVFSKSKPPTPGMLKKLKARGIKVYLRDPDAYGAQGKGVKAHEI